MPTINLQSVLTPATSSLSVTTSPVSGGQLVSVPASCASTTITMPLVPSRCRVRAGTSGDWTTLGGGDAITFTGADAAQVYVAKESAVSGNVTVTVTTSSGITTVALMTPAEYDALASPDATTLYIIAEE